MLGSVHDNGYIQQLGIYPFHVVFFTEGQLLAYVAQCKTAAGATVHVDATGSVVSRIPGQKATFYYCVLLADGNLPISDILSSRHEAAWIQGLFQSFNSAVGRVNNGRLSGDAEVRRHRLLVRADARLYPGLQRRHAARRVPAADVQHLVRSLHVSVDDVEQQQPPPIDDEDTSTVDVGTLKTRSPLTKYFNDFVNDITSATDKRQSDHHQTRFCAGNVE